MGGGRLVTEQHSRTEAIRYNFGLFVEGTMPIYEYRCNACGHELEVIQKMSAAPLVDCPACGKPELTKLISAAGFQLKGTGWYVTDFRSGSKSATTAAASTKSESGEGAGGEGAKAEGAKQDAPAKEESKPAESKADAPSSTPSAS
jgi:putative FmdB family regulatory protein